MIQTMQSELFRIRKSRLFWACLVLAAFFVFALALTFYHNSVNGMLPVISLVSFTEFLFSDYSLIFPLTLFLCLYFTEDFHTGTYSITLSKGTSRVHLFFGKLLASWGGVLFFLFVCFGVAYLSILMMGASRYDIEYSFSAIGVFLLFQCLCFLGYTAFLNLLSYLLRHRIIVTITAFFMLEVLYLYLTKISTALDMDYSLYKYWVVGLSHSLQINTFGEDLIPICLTLVVYLFLPTAISLSLFLRLDFPCAGHHWRMYQFCTLLYCDVFGWIDCLFSQEKNRKLNSAARRQRKKAVVQQTHFHAPMKRRL